jgi:TolA-binding protein
MRAPALLRFGVVIVLGCLGSELRGQTSSKTSAQFTTMRRVQLPAGAGRPEVVVTEFFTHGELQPDGGNLAVTTADGRAVPWRVLQVGPGDFCRVAFQTVPRGTSYRIHYGGKLAAEGSSAWTANAGLLLETRRWKGCNLRQLASVRSAFAGTRPFGAGYVAGVFHGYDPFWPEAEPFLSVYKGSLAIRTPGKYSFFTSSQDCSFLLIDGKQVVAAPGAHGPVQQARIRGEVQLAAGEHAFEYVHAASGGQACMVAAWQPPGAKQPQVIPPEAFGADHVVQVTPGRPEQAGGTLHDFTFKVVGEAPLADVEPPLVRVQFRTAGGGAAPWDFGDGQKSAEPAPVHVYLHPGLFTVKLGGTANRVYIHRGQALPHPKQRPDQLADYTPLLNRYDATRLDPLSALQLVRFCEQTRNHKRAVLIGKSLLLSTAPPTDEDVVRALAELVGPLLDDHFDDPAGALAVWGAAAAAVRRPDGKVACTLQAADIALNELHQRPEAKKLLDEADGHTAAISGTVLASRLQRLWGDWYARAGNKKAALASYAKAAAVQPERRPATERQARRGAYSRSTEAFLRDKEPGRAAEELRRWQDEFPGDKVDGYLPLLLARYYQARGKHAHAIVVANDLLAVNPESPYADQLLFLAAESEEQLGRPDRARALWQALLTDYPGSQLVPEARQKVSRLGGGKTQAPGK